MEDKNGLYYYPNPQLQAVRVYVRRGEDGGIEYRMWDSEHEDVWEKHGWISMEVVNAAIEMFAGSHDNGWNPAAIYDVNIAESLLKDKERQEAKQAARAAAARPNLAGSESGN